MIIINSISKLIITIIAIASLSYLVYKIIKELCKLQKLKISSQALQRSMRCLTTHVWLSLQFIQQQSNTLTMLPMHYCSSICFNMSAGSYLQTHLIYQQNRSIIITRIIIIWFLCWLAVSECGVSLLIRGLDTRN